VETECGAAERILAVQDVPAERVTARPCPWPPVVADPGAGWPFLVPAAWPTGQKPWLTHGEPRIVE
jgi:hypothetical protein